MNGPDFRAVLANWIEQALSGMGTLPPGVSAAEWVAGNALKWWVERTEGDLSDLEYAAGNIRGEARRLAHLCDEEFGELLHEISHLDDAISGLRWNLGLEVPAGDAGQDEECGGPRS